MRFDWCWWSALTQVQETCHFSSTWTKQLSQPGLSSILSSKTQDTIKCTKSMICHMFSGPAWRCVKLMSPGWLMQIQSTIAWPWTLRIWMGRSGWHRMKQSRKSSRTWMTSRVGFWTILDGLSWGWDWERFSLQSCYSQIWEWWDRHWRKWVVHFRCSSSVRRSGVTFPDDTRTKKSWWTGSLTLSRMRRAQRWTHWLSPMNCRHLRPPEARQQESNL